MSGSPEQFDGLAFARSLVGAPGVYRMLGKDDALLYVGKAKNLRKRVESYFARPQMQPRLALLVASVQRMEVVVTRTEAEALLLESQQIRALKPKFNIDLKDDKSYPYLWLTTQDEFPRITYYRGAKEKSGRYFGPFPSAWAVKETVESLQKLFLLRTCDDTMFSHRTRPCLQHQIKRCSAPCVGLVDKLEYQTQVGHVVNFLTGKSQQIVSDIGTAMEQSAAELDFEKAAKYRDQIQALRRISANHYVQGSGDLDAVAVKIEQGMACVVALFFRNGLNLGSKSFYPKLPTEMDEAEVLASFLAQFYTEQPAPPEILLPISLEDADTIEAVLSDCAGYKVKLRSNTRAERAQLVAMAERTAATSLTSQLVAKTTIHARMEALQKLLVLEHPIERIECFDISHTMGESTVASCVVFNAEGPAKAEYRRFSITGITPGDDYAAMHQALTRRYQRIKDGEVKAPDVLLIDGGKGQLAQAFDVLNSLSITTPLVVGVAKGRARKSGFETLFVGPQMREIWPGPDALGGHLIQQVRDEAHRFAITGHRKQRAKKRETSILEEIEGIGPTRRRAILKAFGGLQGVAKAGVEELMQTSGVQRSLAERIYSAFRGKKTSVSG